MPSTVIVTGCSGFIGYHTCEALIAEGYRVIGIDNMNQYYDVELKEARLNHLLQHSDFHFHLADITNMPDMKELLAPYKNIHYVIHLAAQAGVRYSVTNPDAYVQSNLVGHSVILEICRHLPKLKHLVYASSSSVYGSHNTIPFAVDAKLSSPRSLYAATKIANECMSYSYSHLYHIPQTALRFFTVYGPWGRPDMATYSFTKAIIEEKTIDVFNQGQMRRDFTYVSDIVDGILAVMRKPSTSDVPHHIYNLGNHQPIEIMHFLHILEKLVGKKPIIQYKPMHPGDMVETYADISLSERDFGFKPRVSIEDGLKAFVNWYQQFYKC